MHCDGITQVYEGAVRRSSSQHAFHDWTRRQEHIKLVLRAEAFRARDVVVLTVRTSKRSEPFLEESRLV